MCILESMNMQSCSVQLPYNTSIRTCHVFLKIFCFIKIKSTAHLAGPIVQKHEEGPIPCQTRANNILYFKTDMLFSKYKCGKNKNVYE